MSRYGLQVTTPPATEPVTLAEAKAHLRLETTADDTYVTSLITLARQFLETLANRAFITQTLTMTFACWPTGSFIKLPRAPALNITSIQYLDSAGVYQTLSPSNYVLDANKSPGEVWLASNGSWPTLSLAHPQNIKIIYTAGYGAAASAVPEAVKHAIKFQVAEYYENREGGGQDYLTAPVKRLLDSFRVQEF